MLLSYSQEMDEYMPLNLELENSSYPNMFIDATATTDVKPNSDQISLLNISGNRPAFTTDKSSRPDSNVDHLLKIIENQEKQNEKMMIQFRLKQVLIDYLKAKQSSAPPLCSPPSHLNLTSIESQTNYPISTLSPPVSPDISPQFNFGDGPQRTASLMSLNGEIVSMNDQSEEALEMRSSSDSETIDDNLAVVPSKRSNNSKKCNNSTKQSQKRSAHLSAEFRYRTKLNDKISKLRNIVGPKLQLSKSGVLGRSIDLINKLQKANNKLKEENNKMRLLLMQACNQIPGSTSLI